MKSIFILCDFGIPYLTVERLYDNDIKIVDIVADHFKLTPQEIYSKNRSSTIAYPRQIAMYLCRKYLDISLNDIGKAIGDRDHSTVLHAEKKIKGDLAKNDTALENTLEVLAKKLNL